MTTEELGQNSEELCANGDGVPSAMAALGVAAAKELRRWQSGTDFAVSNNSLVLTSTGKAQCSDGRCWNTQAVLDLQRAPFNTIKFGPITFNADNFRSTLVAKHQEQAVCDSRPSNQQGNCTVEAHRLTFRSQQTGSCDTMFTFDASSPTGAPLNFPGNLKNKLIFVGEPSNPYINFTSTGTTVSLDPTYGLVEDSTNQGATCAVTCTKISSASLLGQCCSCSGRNSTFVSASPANPNIFRCQ